MNTSADTAGLPPRRQRQILRFHVALAAGALLIGVGLVSYFMLDTPSEDGKTYAGFKPLPEIHFQDGRSKAVTLADFRGRTVLLNLWATWCVPCRTEMPALNRLQATLGGPGFEVVAVSIDINLQSVRDFYHQYGIKSLAPYLDSTTGIASALGAIGTPTTLLVDREGREVWRRLGPAEWDAPASVAEIRKYMMGGTHL